jgi:hypothetical protein
MRIRANTLVRFPRAIEAIPVKSSLPGFKILSGRRGILRDQTGSLPEEDGAMIMEYPDILDGKEEVRVILLEDREEGGELLPGDHHEEDRDLGRGAAGSGQTGDAIAEAADMLDKGFGIPGADDADHHVPQADPVLHLHAEDGSDPISCDAMIPGIFARFVRTRPVERSQMATLPTPMLDARYLWPRVMYTVRTVSRVVSMIRATRMIRGMVRSAPSKGIPTRNRKFMNRRI